MQNLISTSDEFATELSKAHAEAVKCAEAIQATLAVATPLEALLLLPLIRNAHELASDIEQVLAAHAEKD